MTAAADLIFDFVKSKKPDIVTISCIGFISVHLLDCNEDVKDYLEKTYRKQVFLI